MKRVLVVAMLLGAAGIAHATSDFALTSTTPAAIRMLPGQAKPVTITVTNNGSAAAAPTLITTSIYFLLQGYTITLAEPACGALSEGIYGNYSYSIALSPLDSGASVTCTFVVARDTSVYAASDLALYWTVDVPDDPTDGINFAIGSLIDLSVAITPVAFELDDSGIAHVLDQMVVMNYGPNDVDDFSIGGCFDGRDPPDFAIDADFDGGCGADGFNPGCFLGGLGFRVSAMGPHEVYSCMIRLTGRAAYTEPLHFPIYTGVLTNPDTLGGSLVDIDRYNNITDLLLGPVPEAIFAAGFDD